MRILAQPPELAQFRLIKIGLNGRHAYFHCIHRDGVAIWEVDTLTPSSHKRIFFAPYTKFGYAYAALGRRGNTTVVYLLLAAVIDDSDALAVVLHELLLPPSPSTADPRHRPFYLAEGSLFEFYNVPLHNAALGVGVREEGRPPILFFYDGSIVQGDIPYWRISFDELGWFNLHRDDVPGRDPVRDGRPLADDEPTFISRFPIILDGAKRRFLRMARDRRLFIFTENRPDGKPSSEGVWLPYTADPENEFDITEICKSRGLRETYSSNGHRMTAIESNFAFLVDGNVWILKNKHFSRQRFWRLKLDDDNRTYRFVGCGSAYVIEGMSISQMSYTLVSDRLIVINGSRELAVIPIQPQTLEEIAYWTVQKMVSTLTPDATLSNGWTIQRLAQLLQIQPNLLLNPARD